jgi:tyrosinase
MATYINRSATNTLFYTVIEGYDGPNYPPAAQIAPGGQQVVGGAAGIYLYRVPPATPDPYPFWVGLLADLNDTGVFEINITNTGEEVKVNGDVIYARPNQALLTQAQQQAYINAIQTLNNSGEYGKLVAIHSEMIHDMHGNMGPFGVQRFLPWHRIYLSKFEQALQSVDPTVRIPYWDWTVNPQIPSWLRGFQPLVNMPDGSSIQVVRNPASPPPPFGKTLPTPQNITAVLNNNNFTPFTSKNPVIPRYGGGLEGIHNSVHDWFYQSTMNTVPIASADPIFWMHHAQIDRIWWIWNSLNADSLPFLPDGMSDDSGLPGNIMDPWDNTVQNTSNTFLLGYTYAG